MKPKYSTSACALTIALLTSWLFADGFSQAQTSPYKSSGGYAPPKTFFCDVSDVKKNIPTTLAQTARGDVLIYSWKQPYYADSAETPLARCKRVAGILDTLNKKSLLSAIKAGNMSGKTVICVADAKSGPCTRMVFPLMPNENSQEVLKDLQIALKGKPIHLPSTGKIFHRSAGGSR